MHTKMLLLARCLRGLLLLILHCVPASQQCHNLQHQGSIWCTGSKTCCRKKGLAQLKLTGEKKYPPVAVSTPALADSGCQPAHTSSVTVRAGGAQSNLERSQNLLVLFVINTFWPFHLYLRLGMVILKKGKVKEHETVPRDR